MKKSKSQKGTQDTNNDLGRIARGGMESFLSQLAGSGSGGSTLDRAQDIMYEAWEESDPKKRVILAHQALNVSPDCADAYVLLAEHLMTTIKQAMDLYRKGVEAGGREEEVPGISRAFLGSSGDATLHARARRARAVSLGTQKDRRSAWSLPRNA
ncbi:MAG TPA: hypothetical protein VGR15_09055 [Bacteroidota bacterium]|nr:hypothetical protein [Bacteroidota bacterium]